MTVVVHSACLTGVLGHPLRVEVDILSLLPTFQIVGLAQTSIREARERVRSAVKAVNLPFPRRRITVNLAPADLPKSGTGLDLPIALGLVAADWFERRGTLPWSTVPFAVGELGLDGRIRPIRGVLPLVEAARSMGIQRALVPAENSPEAALVPGIEIIAVPDLATAWRAAQGEPVAGIEHETAPKYTEPVRHDTPDLRQIRGLNWGRRVLEVAAAGGHGLLLEGPPGAGKSMLAKRLQSILPDLNDESALEVTRIRSASGLLDCKAGLIRRPPLRAPHHTASSVAIIGGGRPIRPGEISLAHHGVLLLDEAPEFPRTVLESLRQPLQDGCVAIARAEGTTTLPCRFQLVATRNPCPCGFAGSRFGICTCLPGPLRSYTRRVSGPVLDRIDLVAWIDPVDPQDLLAPEHGESSAAVRSRVSLAQAFRQERDQHTPGGGTTPQLEWESALKRFDSPARTELRSLLRSVRTSARAVGRWVRICTSLSDLEGSDAIRVHHVQEALLLGFSSRDDVALSSPGRNGPAAGRL